MPEEQKQHGAVSKVNEGIRRPNLERTWAKQNPEANAQVDRSVTIEEL